jgi:hypothetical protein
MLLRNKRSKHQDALSFKAACGKLYHRLRMVQDADLSCAEGAQSAAFQKDSFSCQSTASVEQGHETGRLQESYRRRVWRKPALKSRKGFF